MSDEHGHMLVVDDDSMNRMMLGFGLQAEGHTYATADDGQQALERLQAERFDLVLLDIVMPRLDGYEVLARMKGDHALRHIPVIMISALDEIESVVRCIEMGAEDYLPKPFDPVLLRARIGACLEKKRLRDQEIAYLQNVARVIDAAVALEAGEFRPESLDDVVARADTLGQLARTFQRMAREVAERERRLRQQIEVLRIEIDESKTARHVAEITESEYFRRLEARVDRLRERISSEE